MNWILCEDPGTPLWCLQPMEVHANGSSHGPSLEPMRSVDLGKHSVYTHFPKDRNCEICRRTKMTRLFAEVAMVKLYLEQISLVT